ncbi:hypothetical protein P389DRAFT_34505 [Cystobasidium minutum MCA 4210]|uniref:uncharacterized protein n=1 Tax=Cystobasidium minutum MCA 4210 TaxID=1397322 RepID=UPI0034CD503B|eukprot:jgi/Rhomi1/34505/CE34504_487
MSQYSQFDKLPLEVLQNIAENLVCHTRNISRLAECSKRLNRIIKPIALRHIHIQALTLYTLQSCIRDIQDVLQTVRTVKITSQFSSENPVADVIQDDLLRAYSKFFAHLPALESVEVTISVDDSDAVPSFAIHSLPAWRSLAALMGIVNSHSRGKFKPSLHINFRSSDLHISRRVLLHLVNNFRRTGPLAFKLAATCVDWESEGHLPYGLETQRLAWPDNLHPFSIHCWHQWDILTDAPDVPITHLDIGYLSGIHQGASDSVVWPHIISLKIDDCFNFTELFRALLADNMVDLTITLQEAITSELADAFDVLARRSKALTTFNFDIECPCESTEVVQERAAQLEALANSCTRNKITFRFTLRFTPFVHEEHIHPFRSLQLMSSVRPYLEGVLMEIDPDCANEVELPIADFSGFKTVNIHFIGKAASISDVTLPIYLKPMCDSTINTMCLRVPPLDPPALKTLLVYLERIPALQKLQIQRLPASGSHLWHDIEDLKTHIQEMGGWLRIADECARLDVDFNYMCL